MTTNARKFRILLSLLMPFAVVTSTKTTFHETTFPNFVLILTDDLDLTLGGTASLPKTKRLLTNEGLNLSNWFVHTPVCCPSRAELLTGRMFHNLKTPNASAGCMYIDVSSDLNNTFYSNYYFAQHFKKIGYTVGMFGKHLNLYNPENPPRGIDRWMVNGGGNYHNPQFVWASADVQPSAVHFNNCTDKNGNKEPCYSTSIIGNASLDWIQDHIESGVSPEPFFAFISVKAPHIQDGPGYPIATPAPWYVNATVGTNAPRTLNYNASCPDHHWLVRQQGPITFLEGQKIDELYASRQRALLSVDDLVEEVVSTLDRLDILNDTYIVFTSDNGFRLGQFRMPQGKWHVYENDIRVPFLIRGPNLRRGSVREDVLGTHVDLMPTLLGLAKSNATIPSTMDGEDLSQMLQLHDDKSRKKSSVLIEYIGLGDVIRYGHLEDTYNNSFRALRVIDETQPAGRRNVKYIEFTNCMEDW
eukprot:CAMPEP_0194242198 /NCGR_PEP_ID=MMETSP0158-20130606/7807_1 /TAXON_ID=33649 /ORGANISM="Thalassionema nitzschioides, Strain L26-B" /LENGTH=471 /DNA_ID=CAMNT_0038977239 /DNA_START=112 /DNA_END=1524 /DNA_ORIENTATION=-